MQEKIPFITSHLTNLTLFLSVLQHGNWEQQLLSMKQCFHSKYSEVLLYSCICLTPLSFFFNSFTLAPYDCAKRKRHLHPGAHGHRCLSRPHPPHSSNLCLLPSALAHLFFLWAPLAQSGGSSHLAQPWCRSRWRGHRSWGSREHRAVVTTVTRGSRQWGLSVSHEQHGHLHRNWQLWQRW